MISFTFLFFCFSAQLELNLCKFNNIFMISILDFYRENK